MAIDQTVLNVALLPSADIEKKFQHLSNAFHGARDNEALLGRDGLAHLTLLQIEVAPRDITVVKNAIQSLSSDSLVPSEIVCAGLAFLPSSAGDLWIEVPVLQSQELRHLHQSVFDALVDLGEVRSGSGDRYRPHITLGYYSDVYAVGKIAEAGLSSTSWEVVRETTSGWKLALGVSGRNFTFQRELAK